MICWGCGLAAGDIWPPMCARCAAVYADPTNVRHAGLLEQLGKCAQARDDADSRIVERDARRKTAIAEADARKREEENRPIRAASDAFRAACRILADQPPTIDEGDRAIDMARTLLPGAVEDYLRTYSYCRSFIEAECRAYIAEARQRKATPPVVRCQCGYPAPRGLCGVCEERAVGRVTVTLPPAATVRPGASEPARSLPPSVSQDDERCAAPPRTCAPRRPPRPITPPTPQRRTPLSIHYPGRVPRLPTADEQVRVHVRRLWPRV